MRELQEVAHWVALPEKKETLQMNVKFLAGAFCGVAFMTSLVAVNAQQAGPAPDPQELQIQLNLTDQALGNANHQFIAERTQTLLLRNQLAQAQADAAKEKAESDKKDKEIADLKGKLASAAAVRPPVATPVPADAPHVTPPAPVAPNAGGVGAPINETPPQPK